MSNAAWDSGPQAKRLDLRLDGHQAKGREMDAVVIVNHPDDFEKAESLRNDRRVLFVMGSRARQSVTLVLRPDPTSLFAPSAALAAQ